MSGCFSVRHLEGHPAIALQNVAPHDVLDKYDHDLLGSVITQSMYTVVLCFMFVFNLV